MASLNFDATTAPAREQRASTPLPAGIYVAEITGSDVAPLKSGRGTGLNLEFTVISPEEHGNRRVWQQLNIKHENQQAEEISLGMLKELCDSLGIAKLTDSDDLFGRVVQIKTKIRPAKGDWPAKAEVAGYATHGVPPARPAPAAASKPWAR